MSTEMKSENTGRLTNEPTTNDNNEKGGITIRNVCAYPADQQDSGCGAYYCSTSAMLTLGKDRGPDDLSIDDPGVDAGKKSVKVLDSLGKRSVLVDPRLKKLAEAILPSFKLEKCFLHRRTRLVSLVFGDIKTAAEFCICTKDTVASISSGEWRSGTVIKKVIDPGSEVMRLAGNWFVEFPADDIKEVIRIMELWRQYSNVCDQ